MSEHFVLHRRDPIWVWLAVGVLLCAVLLVMRAYPSAGRDDAGVTRVPVVRPHSNTLPMPPPSVARTRDLAA